MMLFFMAFDVLKCKLTCFSTMTENNERHKNNWCLHDKATRAL